MRSSWIPPTPKSVEHQRVGPCASLWPGVMALVSSSHVGGGEQDLDCRHGCGWGSVLSLYVGGSLEYSADGGQDQDQDQDLDCHCGRGRGQGLGNNRGYREDSNDVGNSPDPLRNDGLACGHSNYDDIHFGIDHLFREGGGSGGYGNHDGSRLGIVPRPLREGGYGGEDNIRDRSPVGEDLYCPGKDGLNHEDHCRVGNHRDYGLDGEGWPCHAIPPSL